VNDKEPFTSERFICDILARYPDPSGIIVPPAAYLPEDSLTARADRAFEHLIQNSQDAYACATTSATPQEPLTIEDLTQVLQELKEQYQWTETPAEIQSMAGFLRRTGFRVPLSEETLSALEPPSPLTRIKQDLLYGTSFLPIKDGYRLSVTPEGAPEISLTAVGAQHLLEEFKALCSEPSWTISPKTHHQLLRLAAQKRRQYRAWLRAKRQRRAHQRRHHRGLC
jgi:hypothetical protein